MKHVMRVSVWLAGASCAIELFVVIDTFNDWQPHTTIAASVAGLWLFAAFLWWVVEALPKAGGWRNVGAGWAMPRQRRAYGKRVRRYI